MSAASSPPVQVEALAAKPVARRRVEVVERKGVGHPDTICDAVAEAVSHALCRRYLEVAGRVLHHNVDKALLIAGRSEPRPGGGRVLEPMRLVLGGRATDEHDGRPLGVRELALDAAARWFEQHLRFVRSGEHLELECAVRPGSAQLVDVFARGGAPANDTSVGVGYAPLTETERLVLAAERTVNGAAFRARFPEAGEDVKVMGVRVGRSLELTLAVAFVDRFVPDARAYFERKRELRGALLRELEGELRELDALDLVINALDREERGTDGMYLTVLGTSADGADGGQVGRGNRVNGLIAFQRPTSLEAAAGKNPVRHVGKVYNLLAGRIAAEVHARVGGVEEVQVLLCSRIGEPVERPWIATAQLVLADGAGLGDVEDGVRAVVERELASLPAFVEGLVREGSPVY